MPLHNGTLLNERYRIDRILGQGGMGAVYLALDESLGVPVAVKENLNVSPESERQFKREANLLATLRHHHLPRVTDHFVLGGQQYLVMDFVEGEDLKERLHRAPDGFLPEADVVRWGAQICDALVYLHSLTPSVVHRDIKPGNIKLNAQGEATLVDFGIAKASASGQKTTTAAAAFTPGFAPPEQYGMGRTDPRTDQYALAATLYTLLTGKTPIDSMERLLGNLQLEPPHQARPDLSPAVSAALMRALELKPDDRFEMIAQFKAALLGREPVTAPVKKVTAATPTVMSGAAPTIRSEAPETIKLDKPVTPAAAGRPGWLIPVIGIAALVMAGGALLGGALLGGGTPTAQPTATPAIAQVATRTSPVSATPTETLEATATPAPANTATPPPPTATVTTEPPTAVPTVAGTPIGGATGRIAFISNRDGQRFQVYTMNADGSDIQSITTDDRDKWSPDWQLGKLGRLPGPQLAWSPDGAKLLYVAEPQPGAGLDVWVVNADGSDPQNITPTRSGFAFGDEMQPAWCADGTIAFTSTRINAIPQIFITRLEDRAARNFSAIRSSPIEYSPQFFADCRRMLLVTTQNGVPEIWRMYPFKNVLDQMWGAFPPKDQTSYRFFISDKDAYGGAAAQEHDISPDDQYVIYTRTTGNGPDIILATVDDSPNRVQFQGLTNSANNTSPTWSPDGKRITFVSKRDSLNQQIFIMLATGAQPTNLTQDPDHIYVSPVWQPGALP